MRRTLARLVFALLLLASASALAAHDTWLAPAAFDAAPGSRVSLHLTSGETFPQDDFAIEPTRLQQSWMRLAGRRSALEVIRRGPLALELSAVLPKAGVATLWVALAPKTLELTENKVDEYFTDIDATEAVRARWRSMPKPRRWRESYRKHTKSFVKVGDVADSSWATPVGLALEIVPLRDPTRLRVGDTLVVRVLRDGKALHGLRLALARGTTNLFQTTDGDGRARFAVAQAGAWMLHGTDLRPSKRKGLEWESDFTTLTFFVHNR